MIYPYLPNNQPPQVFQRQSQPYNINYGPQTNRPNIDLQQQALQQQIQQLQNELVQLKEDHQQKNAQNTVTINTEQQPDSENKGAYGIKNVGVQQYIPVGHKRDFNTEEQASINKGLKRWWPALIQHYGTPVPQMLASPVKVGILSGLGVGAVGAVVGILGGGTLIGVLAAAGLLLGGITGYMNQERQNGTLIELMRHFPHGATKRDLLSDAAYQKDQDRKVAAASGGNNAGSTILGAAVLGSALSKS